MDFEKFFKSDSSPMLARPKAPAPKKILHLRKIHAQIRPFQAGLANAQTPSSGLMIVNEFKSNELAMYSTQYFNLNQRVSIVLELAEPIYIKARVIWIKEVLSDSKVMPKERFKYRVGFEIVIPESAQDRLNLETARIQLVQGLEKAAA